MARTNGPIQVWSRSDTTPTDGEGGYAGGDSTAAAVGMSLDQSSRALGTVDNLVVTARTLDYGQEATATISGTSPWKTIDIGIPEGMPDTVGASLVADAQTAAQQSTTSAAEAAASADWAQQAHATSLQPADDVIAAAMRNELTETGGHLSSTYASQQQMTRVGTLPVATDVTLTVHSGSMVTPRECFDGYFWGTDSTGQIHRSLDAVTWTAIGAPAPVELGGFIKNGAGELVATSGPVAYKTSGWAADPATATWAVVAQASTGSATFNRHCFSGSGDKFILTEYSSVARVDSKWAQISLDGGATWSIVWDSTVRFPTTHAESHLHTACYDPWADRFFIAEGHGAPTGIYYSDDDGATWTRMTGGLADTLEPTPTVMTATDDGIVCGSDAATWAVFGIVRTDNPADMTLVGLYRWDDSRDGVLGFGLAGWRDPVTGVVTIPFLSAGAGGYPIVTSGTATKAALTWTSPDGGSESRVYGAFILDGTIAMVTTTAAAGERKIGVGRATRATPTLNAHDDGNARGGTVQGANTSLSVGLKSSTGGWSRSVAVGPAATAGGANGDGTSVGYTAAAAADGTALGAAAQATGTAGALASGVDSVASGTQSSAVGATATASATQAAAVGFQANAGGAYSVAVGARAVASTTRATAIGRDAAATHASSTAIGADVVTTYTNQLAVGPRHIELGAHTPYVPAPAAGAARLYVKDDGGRPGLFLTDSAGTRKVTLT